MKPTVVADEMFPEGAGPYMDLEEVPYWIFDAGDENSGFVWRVPRMCAFSLRITFFI